MIGTTISHYRVLEKIGEGGMGAVYLAEDTRLDRRVALKFLPEELTRDEARKQRFIREARAAAAIPHPHILAVHDIDEVEGQTFIAMEYVPGQSLRELIASGQLDLRRSLELGVQMAEGLAKAHEKGVVHRDVKPENVLVSEDGYAKLIDFGLAKLFEPAGSRKDGADLEEAETQIKTQEGLVVGTVAYMSPEQALGEPLDARSDVFSLGAVLYEMLSGGKRLRSKAATSSLRALLEESPPPLTLPGPETPAEIQKIVEKAVARERAQRYPSMKELARDLRELRERLGSGSRPMEAARSRPSRAMWVGGAVAVGGAALLALGLYFFGWGRPASAPGIGASGRPAIAVMEFESLTGDKELQWLARGLPSMLTTDLAQTPGLDVVSSQRLHEVLRQLGEDDLASLDPGRVAEIARRAGAGAIAVGSIIKAGKEVRIDVQLEDVASGRILVAHSVRGTDVFALADELSDRIRAGLDVGDRPAGRSLAEVTTTSLEAYRLYSEGLQALRNSRADDAQRLFRQAINLDPSFAMANYQLFVAGGGREYLDRALELQDRLPERQRLYLQAQDARRHEDYEKARELYETLISRYPDEVDAYMELSWLQDRDVRDTAGALATVQRGLEAIPSSGPLHNHLAYLLLEQGRYPEAIRALEAYATLSPGEPNPYDSLGDAYLTAGQPEKARAAFTRALEVDPSFPAAEGLAFARGMMGRYDEALESLDRWGAGCRPRCDSLYHVERAFYVSRLGRYREAQEHVQKAEEAAEERSRPGWTAICEELAAYFAIERGDSRRALEHTERARQVLPQLSHEASRIDNSSRVHLLAGVALARSGDLEGARKQLDEQEKLDRGTEERRWWHGALAGEVALAEGDLAAAESAFAGAEPTMKPAGLDDPSTTFFRDGRTRVKVARGDLAGAIEAYRALNTPGIANKWTALLEPRYVLEVARLLDKLGRHEEAAQEYQRFLELWKNADEGLPERAEARAYLARRGRSG
jgi:tetratricopeptide (TPR) repeat protein/tRNA A-37 threonylcarbamoyl transferase component Bud32